MFKNKLFFAAAAVILFSVSCKGHSTKPGVTESGLKRITITSAPQNGQAFVGSSFRLGIDTDPFAYNLENPKWDSSDKNKATVNKGEVKCIADGTVTITVKDEKSGKSASCLINISPEPTAENASIALEGLEWRYTHEREYAAGENSGGQWKLLNASVPVFKDIDNEFDLRLNVGNSVAAAAYKKAGSTGWQEIVPKKAGNTINFTLKGVNTGANTFKLRLFTASEYREFELFIDAHIIKHEAIPGVQFQWNKEKGEKATMIIYSADFCHFCDQAYDECCLIYKKYAGKGLKVVIIAKITDGTGDVMNGKLASHKVTYPCYKAPVSSSNGNPLIMQDINTQGYPTIGIYDASGARQYYKLGLSPQNKKDIIAKLEELCR